MRLFSFLAFDALFVWSVDPNPVPIHHPEWQWFAWPFRLINGFIQWQAPTIGNVLGVHSMVVGDFEALAFLATVFISTFFLNRKHGMSLGFMKSIQIAAIPLMMCGAWIMFTDYKEFYIYVTSFQARYDVFPWFSNFDLLVSSIIVFSISTLLSRRMASRDGQNGPSLFRPCV